MSNIEQIAEQLRKANLEACIDVGILHPGGTYPAFDMLNPGPRAVWVATAKAAVRCRAESALDTVASIRVGELKDIPYQPLDQTRKSLAEQQNAFHQVALDMQEANDAEYGIPIVRQLPRNGQLVDARYEGVYDWRRVRFWLDGNKTPHFGTIDSADGKGSQPATHWRPVNVEPPTMSTPAPEPVAKGYDWMDEARGYVQSCFNVEQLTQLVAGWMQTAAQHNRNEEFYRGVVTKIGELFGDAAKTSDDGSVQQDVLALKVLPCVQDLISVRADQADQIRMLEQENAELRSRVSDEGTYGWALEAMKRGEAVKLKQWPDTLCLVLRRGAASEDKPFCDVMPGAVYRYPGIDIHGPLGYGPHSVSAFDQLSDEWEIVKQH